MAEGLIRNLKLQWITTGVISPDLWCGGPVVSVRVWSKVVGRRRPGMVVAYGPTRLPTIGGCRGNIGRRAGITARTPCRRDDDPN